MQSRKLYWGVNIMQFKEEVFKHLPWSYSKLETARRCPFNFNRKYVDKIKVPYVENEAAKIGNLVHCILEECLKGSVDVNGAYHKICVGRNQLTKLEMEKCASYRPGIIQFLDKIKQFEKTTPVRRKLVEIEVAITTDFEPAEYWGKDPVPLIRGKMDFGLLAANGHLAIFDHKTGGAPTKQYSGNQMLTYEVLSHYGLGENISGVQTMLHYVSSEALLPFDGVSADDIINKRKFEFIQFVNGCVSEIQEDIAKEGKHCDWCGYHHMCPLKK
jgi:hypothetical protein